MLDVPSAIANNRAAVTDFLGAVRTVPPAAWGQPRAPGKWSPGQVAEHLALSYEYSRRLLHGPVPGPAAPRFLRPVIRILLLRNVLRTGRFPKRAKAPPLFQPGPSPAPAADLSTRLQTAADSFESELIKLSHTGDATLDHPFFGQMMLADYMQLQALHTRHHRQQIGSTV